MRTKLSHDRWTLRIVIKNNLAKLNSLIGTSMLRLRAPASMVAVPRHSNSPMDIVDEC